MTNKRLRIAVQKSGRLHTDSLNLLSQCGIKIHIKNNALVARAENLPIDILLVRDDDIPTFVMDNICHLGIVGENILLEKEIFHKKNGGSAAFKLTQQLGFGRCKLAIAMPADNNYVDFNSLQNLAIATSYPHLLSRFLTDQKIQANILTISGSVEIAPHLGMADAICDLVSTGQTLEENNLKEVATIIESQAVLIESNRELAIDQKEVCDLLLRRINGVIKAQESKYILFHAPISALATIKNLLPGFESPTISPLQGFEDKVVVQVVSTEGVFWGTLEKLKQAGASSILVLPIEKMLS